MVHHKEGDTEFSWTNSPTLTFQQNAQTGVWRPRLPRPQTSRARRRNLHVTLSVTDLDDAGRQYHDSFRIYATNTLPTASAGGSYVIDEGSSLTLNATTSFDVLPGDNDLATYQWDLDTTASSTTRKARTPNHLATLAALGLPTDGTARPIRLRVTDGESTEATAFATLTINNLPRRPVPPLPPALLLRVPQPRLPSTPREQRFRSAQLYLGDRNRSGNWVVIAGRAVPQPPRSPGPTW